MEGEARAPSAHSPERRVVLRTLFRILRVLGDARAVGRGPKAMGKRYARRQAYRGVRKLFR
jgi:hypothetical protein